MEKPGFRIMPIFRVWAFNLYATLSLDNLPKMFMVSYQKNPALQNPGSQVLPDHFVAKGPRMLFFPKRTSQGDLRHGSSVCCCKEDPSVCLPDMKLSKVTASINTLVNSTKGREKLSKLLRATLGFPGETVRH